MYTHNRKPLPQLQGSKRNDHSSGQSRGGMDLAHLSSAFGNQAMLSLLGMSDRQGPAIPTASRGGAPLSDVLREKFERKSGIPLDDVRVHYNSDKPAELGAAAYTYGTDVFIGPEQEKSLDHELTHVVQQKQGIVRPTEHKGGVPLNTSIGLEHSADMGHIPQSAGDATQPVVQCDGYEEWEAQLAEWAPALRTLIESGLSCENLAEKLYELIGSTESLNSEDEQIQTNLVKTLLNIIDAKPLLVPEKYQFASVENEAEGAGSFYFTEDLSVTEGEPEVLPNIRRLRAICRDKTVPYAERRQAQKELQKQEANLFAHGGKGARMRLLHKHGPEIVYHNKLLQGAILCDDENCPIASQQDAPPNEHYHLYEIFTKMESAQRNSYLRMGSHKSRGVCDTDDKYRPEANDLENLYYAISFLQLEIAKAKYAGASEEIISAMGKNANALLFQYIQKIGSDKLKGMPINGKKDFVSE